MELQQEMARLMGRVHALEARTDASERRILAAANEREKAVCERMEELRGKVLLERDAAREYQVLALERRRLSLVIGLAQAHTARNTPQGPAADSPGKAHPAGMPRAEVR